MHRPSCRFLFIWLCFRFGFCFSFSFFFFFSYFRKTFNLSGWGCSRWGLASAEASILEIDFKSGFTGRCEIPYVSCFPFSFKFLLVAYTPLSKLSPFVGSRLRRGHAKRGTHLYSMDVH